MLSLGQVCLALEEFRRYLSRIARFLLPLLTENAKFFA